MGNNVIFIEGGSHTPIHLSLVFGGHSRLLTVSLLILLLILLFSMSSLAVFYVHHFFLFRPQIFFIQDIYTYFFIIIIHLALLYLPFSQFLCPASFAFPSLLLSLLLAPPCDPIYPWPVIGSTCLPMLATVASPADSVSFSC